MSRRSRLAIAALLATPWSAPALLASGFKLGLPLKPDTTLTPGGHYGSAVAVGNGMVAVGAYLAGPADAPESGAVYLFLQDRDGGWSFSPPVLRGKNAGDWFGFDVAIDGGTLLVGAPHARDESRQRTGAAYSLNLTPPGGPLMPLPILGGREGDEIGSAVAVSGDIWAVGARGDSQAGHRAGKVYVFQKGQQILPNLLPDAAGAGGEFGQSVSLDGDLLAVGAPFDAVGGPDAGAAYWFRRVAGAWPETGTRLPAATRPGAAFGYSVAASGGRIAVGAPLDDRRGAEAGAAYLYTQSDGIWQQAVPLAADAGAGAQLGVAMAFDRGGRNEIVAGARRAFGDAGAAYRFKSDGSFIDAVQPPLPAHPRAQFGYGVALHNDTLLAGAFMQDGGAGAAYLFAQSVTLRLAESNATFPESVGLVRLGVVVDTDDRQPTSAPVTVNVVALPGTALAGSDFQLLDHQLTIPQGQRPGELRIVRIAIFQDPLLEDDESFTVALTDPQGAVLGDPSTETITVHDDDPAALVIAFAHPPRLVTNDDGGADQFTVALVSQPSAPVTVALTGAEGRGVISPPGPLVFTPATWNQPQLVTVAGVEAPAPRCLGTAATSYEIALTTASADPRYAALSPPAAPAVPVVLRHRDRTLIAASLAVCPQSDGTVFYYLLLANQGECALDELPGTELTDLLPWDKLALVAATADQGVATVDLVANRVSWTGALPPGAGALPPGAQVTIRIIAALQGGVLPGTPVANQGFLTYPSQRRGPLDSMVSTYDPVALPGPPDPTVPHDPTVFLAGAALPACP